MKRLWLLVVCLLALGAPASAVDWSATWENDPQDGDSLSDGANQIRIFKDEARFRAEVEHQWGSANTDDNGLHHKGSGRCFEQTAAPTVILQGDYDNTQTPGASGGGTATLTATETNDSGTDTVGEGRCWFDTDGPDGIAGGIGANDDYTLYVHNGTAWVEAVAGDGIIGDNLIFNGSFEMCGETACGTAASTTIPDGWTVQSTPSFTYATTATEDDGDHVVIENTAGSQEGITQTLGGLRGTTSYLFVVRANPTTAGTDCTLRVTGGATTPVTDVSVTAGNVFETLAVVATTNSTPTDLVVALESNNGGDDCGFDSAGAYAISADDTRSRPLPRPGILTYRTTTTAGNTACDETFATAGCSSILSLTVTPPSPGYVVWVQAKLHAECTADGDELQAQLWDGASSLDLTTHETSSNDRGGPLTLQFLGTTPAVAGTGLTYTVRARENSGDTCIVYHGDDMTVAVPTESINWLQVILLPTG